MTNSEMNRRIATLTETKVAHIQRLIRNGYDAREINNFRIGATLAQINAVFQLDTHWEKAA
jgi:hypothetical protein